MNTKPVLWSTALWIAIVSLAMSSPCQAAANDLDGTRWEFSMAASASVAKVGKLVTVSNPVFEFFKDNNNVNKFRILDEGDIEVLAGKYSIDGKGKAVLTPDPSGLQNLLDEWVWDVLDNNLEPGVQVSFSANDIVVQKMTFTAVLKSTPALQTLTVKANIRATVQAQVSDDVGTENITGTATLALTGISYKDGSAYSASVWAIPDASEKASVAGYGALTGTTPLLLTLEAKPQGFTDSLPAFHVSDNQGTAFTGTYLRNKNKITFFFDTDSIEQVMENAIIQQVQQMYHYTLDPSEIWIDVTSIKSSGAIKKEQSIQFSIQASYSCYLLLNNDLLVLKSSYALKGTGPIQQP